MNNRYQQLAHILEWLNNGKLSFHLPIAIDTIFSNLIKYMSQKLTKRTIHLAFSSAYFRHFCEAKFTMAPSHRDKNRNEDINKTSCGCSCAYSHRVTRTVRTYLAKAYFHTKQKFIQFHAKIESSNSWNKASQWTFVFLPYARFIRPQKNGNKYLSCERNRLTVAVVGLFPRHRSPGSRKPR